METLANLASFVRSAEAASFSAAARHLRLTPAAVSRNVAVLERNLGVRLFQRSTRKLTLTEAGRRFLVGIGDKLDALQAAIADASAEGVEPMGTLKVSMSLAFGVRYIIPALPGFLSRYPGVKIDWHFDSRQVDLVGESFDAAIGAGFDLAAGVVARPLGPAHLVAVASPAFVKNRTLPKHPRDLAWYEGIVLRSATTGRVRHRVMRNKSGEEAAATLRESVSFDDPAAMVAAAVAGVGVTLLALADVLDELESGALVRLLPHWYADVGSIYLYYSSRSLQPRKVKAFVEYLLEHCREEQLTKRFTA